MIGQYTRQVIACCSKVSAVRAVMIFVIFAAVVVGCGPKRVASPVQESDLLHTISYQGETFTIISAWYTGSGQNWRQIASANPTVRPNRLRPGMMIRIPRVLLTRDEPLPRSFVDAATSKLKNMPMERGSEDAFTPPPPVETPEAPKVEEPKALPPVVEETPAIVEPEAPSSMPTLPDPTEVAPTAVPEVVSSSSEAAVIQEEVVSSEAVPTPVPAPVSSSSEAAVSSAAAVTSKDDAHQKTRDQLLKELLQDY